MSIIEVFFNEILVFIISGIVFIVLIFYFWVLLNRCYYCFFVKKKYIYLVIGNLFIENKIIVEFVLYFFVMKVECILKEIINYCSV